MSEFDHHAELVTVTILDDGNVMLTIETDDGDVVNIGEHGGMSADYIAELMDDYGEDWADYLLDAIYDSSYSG